MAETAYSGCSKIPISITMITEVAYQRRRLDSAEKMCGTRGTRGTRRGTRGQVYRPPMFYFHRPEQ